MHSRVVRLSPVRSTIRLVSRLVFSPRSSSALVLQVIPPPSTWPGPISALFSSKVSWPTALPPAVN